MDAGLKKLFARRKGTAHSNEPRGFFLQTSEYGSLQAGPPPQVGGPPIKPSETRQSSGYNRTKNPGAHKSASSITGRRSRTQSLSRSRSLNGQDVAHGYRTNSTTTDGIPSLSSVVPPVPNLRASFASSFAGRSGGGSIDLFEAVGYGSQAPYHNASHSDLYGEAVAERNSTRNLIQQLSGKRRPPVDFAEDVADRNILHSPEPQHASYDLMKNSNYPAADQSISSTTEGRRWRDVYSTAQLYGVGPGQEQDWTQPPGTGYGREDPPRVSSTSSRLLRDNHLHVALGKRVPSTGRSPTQDHNADVDVGRQVHRSLIRKSNGDDQYLSLQNYQPGHSSDKSTGSLYLFPRPESRRRQASGRNAGSDASEISDFGHHIAEAGPGNSEALRASMIGPEGYVYRGEPSASRSAASHRPEESSPSGRDEPMSEINKRATEALQKRQMQGPQSDFVAPLQVKTVKDRLRRVPDFDLLAEFRRLNEMEPAAHAQNRLSGAVGNDADHGATGSRGSWEAEPSGDVFLDQRGLIGQAVTTDAIVRDFASPHPRDPSRFAASMSVEHADHPDSDSDSDSDAAVPPQIMRQRAPTSGRNSYTANRNSGDFSRQIRSVLSLDHNRSSKPHDRRPSTSHTLHATIDGRDDASDQGYLVESIARKRDRSRTLETMARTPLNTRTSPNSAQSPNVDRLKDLKDQLSSIQASIPDRNRTNSLRSSTTAPPYLPRANSSQLRQPQPPPLRQYHHQPSPNQDSRSPASEKIPTSANTYTTPPASSPSTAQSATSPDSRRNSIFSTTTTPSIRSSTSTGLPRVPPRYSSLSQQTHSHHTAQGGYFGKDAVASVEEERRYMSKLRTQREEEISNAMRDLMGMGSGTASSMVDGDDEKHEHHHNDVDGAGRSWLDLRSSIGAVPDVGSSKLGLLGLTSS